MRKANVSLGLAKRSVANLILFIRGIVLAMTGNANFMAPNPLPSPPLADLDDAADDLEEAEEKKKSLGIANRDEKRIAAQDLVTNEARYVVGRANGEGSIIESAGMSLRKDNSPQDLPGVVTGVKAADGSSAGEILFTHKGTTGKGNEYYTEYNLDQNLAGKWTPVEPPIGKRKVLITSLPSGRKVAFRVRAKNTAGYGPYSAVVFRIVQ